jgi:PKD repeat protein
MQSFFFNLIKTISAFILVALLATSCEEDEPMSMKEPSASFEFTATELTVSFSNTSSNATSYTWTFGDGNSSTEENPSHTYAAPGTYTVVLTANNDEGSATTNSSVSVMEPEPIDLGYVMSLKVTGSTEPEFLVTKSDLMTGEIDATGTGIEQTGWRFYYPVGNTLFASGYSEDNQCAGYIHDGEGNLVKSGEFIFENALEMFGSADDGETFLAMEIPRAGFANRRLHFIDENTVFVKKIVGTRIFESTADSLIAWPTALRVRDGKLFIPFHKLDAKGFFTTPSPDSAFVAVYDYPNVTAEPTKIIADSRTSNIGVNGATTGLIQVDNGDLYSFSCGAEMAGFAPASAKPSGVLRIPSGSTDFDDSYFFNVEEATNGGKIFWMDYLEGNKVLARILLDDNGGAWAAFGRSEFNQKLVILDLEAQTVTDVANVPLHAKRYSSPLLVENGKAFVSIETASEAYVYEVDIATATGTKGAKINGKTIKGFYRLEAE